MKREERKENLEIKIKTLEFLQNIILRMADNSFKIKGWVVALNVSLFTLLILLIRLNYVEYGYFISFIFIISIILLSTLDAYYLKLERSFRLKHENVAVIGLEENNKWNFDLKITKREQVSFMRAYLSPSILLFYCPILLVLLVLTLLLSSY